MSILAWLCWIHFDTSAGASKTGVSYRSYGSAESVSFTAKVTSPTLMTLSTVVLRPWIASQHRPRKRHISRLRKDEKKCGNVYIYIYMYMYMYIHWSMYHTYPCWRAKKGMFKWFLKDLLIDTEMNLMDLRTLSASRFLLKAVSSLHFESRDVGGFTSRHL